MFAWGIRRTGTCPFLFLFVSLVAVVVDPVCDDASVAGSVAADLSGLAGGATTAAAATAAAATFTAFFFVALVLVLVLPLARLALLADFLDTTVDDAAVRVTAALVVDVLLRL